MIGKLLSSVRRTVWEKVVDALLVLAGGAVLVFLAGIGVGGSDGLEFRTPSNGTEMTGDLKVVVEGEVPDGSQLWIVADTGNWYPLQQANRSADGTWAATVADNQIITPSFQLCAVVVDEATSRRLREARDDPARGLDRSTVSDADEVPCVDMSKDVA